MSFIVSGIKIKNRYKLESKIRVSKHYLLWKAIDEKLLLSTYIYIIKNKYKDLVDEYVLKYCNYTQSVGSKYNLLDMDKDANYIYLIFGWFDEKTSVPIYELNSYNTNNTSRDNSTNMSIQLLLHIHALHQYNLVNGKLYIDSIIYNFHNQQIMIMGVGLDAILNKNDNELLEDKFNRDIYIMLEMILFFYTKHVTYSNTYGCEVVEINNINKLIDQSTTIPTNIKHYLAYYLVYENTIEQGLITKLIQGFENNIFKDSSNNKLINPMIWSKFSSIINLFKKKYLLQVV